MDKDELKKYLVKIVDSLDDFELANLEVFFAEKDKQLDISKELAVISAEVKNFNKIIKKFKDEADEFKSSKLMEFYKKVEVAKELSQNIPKCSFFNKKEFLKSLNDLKEIVNELENGYGNILKEFGIIPLAKIGDKFDMNYHEAIDGSGDIIVEIYEQGFKIGDKILNYAKVKVGK